MCYWTEMRKNWSNYWSCAQDLLRGRKTFEKKNGPLKPKKGEKRKRKGKKDGVEMGKHLGRSFWLW